MRYKCPLRVGAVHRPDRRNATHGARAKIGLRLELCRIDPCQKCRRENGVTPGAKRFPALCVHRLTGQGAVVNVGHEGTDHRAHGEGNGGIGGVVDGDDGSATGNSGVVEAHVARGRDQGSLVIDWPLRSSAQHQQGSGKQEAQNGLHAAGRRRSGSCCARMCTICRCVDRFTQHQLMKAAAHGSGSRLP